MMTPDLSHRLAIIKAVPLVDKRGYDWWLEFCARAEYAQHFEALSEEDRNFVLEAEAWIAQQPDPYEGWDETDIMAFKEYGIVPNPNYDPSTEPKHLEGEEPIEGQEW